MTPEAEAIMDRACAEMTEAGERFRARQAANPPRPPFTIAEMAEIFRFRVASINEPGVARLGITAQLHDRLLAEQAKR
jgi:hypothetical protein